MALTVARTFVQVDDVDLAVSFYRDALGLAVLMDVPKDDYRWVTVGSPSQPDVCLVITNYVDGSPEDVAAVAALVAKGVLPGVHFHSDDLDGDFEKIAATGVDVVQEPTTQFWGRDCAVRDPSGNLVRIDQT